MSLMEIFDYIKAKRKKEQEDRKWLVQNMYTMAQVTAEHIGGYISKEIVPRAIWDIYPGAFEEERIQAEEDKARREAETAKANRIARAKAAAQRKFMEEVEKWEGGG